MKTKLAIAGFILGATTASIIADAIFRKKSKKYQAEKEGEIAILQNENDEVTNKYNEIVHDYENLCKFNCQMTKNFASMLDPNMLADIASISNVAHRDACLSAIEDTVEMLSSYHIHKSENISDEELEDITNKINNRIKYMTDTIKEHIEDDDDEIDEDEEESENNIVSIRNLLLTGVNGTDKIFVMNDPDGYVTDKYISDPDNNVFCINAEYSSELYEFLKENSYIQNKSNYLLNIDQELFDDVNEDADEILVYFSFINEYDAVITNVINGNTLGILKDPKSNNYYHVKEVDVSNDKFIHFSRSITNSNIISDGEETSASEEETELDEEEETVDSRYNMDEMKEYLIDVINYNKSSLDYFIGRLKILNKANNEAWKDINGQLVDIIIEIDGFRKASKLTDIKKTEFKEKVKTILQGMKNKYKLEIELYEQSHNI